MKSKKNLARILFLVLITTMLFSSYASAASNHVITSRGTFLLWSKSHFEWGYSYGKVNWTDVWQEGGSFGLNTISFLGTSSTKISDSLYKGRSSYLTGVGVATPWGGFNVVQSTTVDQLYMEGDGGWY